jgi:hypothetical protein
MQSTPPHAITEVASFGLGLRRFIAIQIQYALLERPSAPVGEE